ncbi:large ribosomal subunit protein bL19cy-like [Carex rostrata]
MASSSLLSHSLLPLPTASPLFPKSSLAISSLSFSLNQISISRTGSVALHPLVRRCRESSFGIARAGETGEEETTAETGEDESSSETGGEEISVAVAVEEKPPKKPIVKLGDIIGILNKKFIEEAETIKVVPDIRPGDVVEIKKTKLNRRRLALYKGIVISKHSGGIHTTIRIRFMTSGTPVELVFPVYSPKIKEIKVVSHRDVRRAKLYYLREKLPRFYTFKKK